MTNGEPHWPAIDAVVPPDGPLGDLLAFGQQMAEDALAAKARDQYQFWQGWNAALDRLAQSTARAKLRAEEEFIRITDDPSRAGPDDPAAPTYGRCDTCEQDKTRTVTIGDQRLCDDCFYRLRDRPKR